jgi:hypothetical protein
VQARNERFLVCTKPFNCRKTVLYTIVDLVEKIRGLEGLVFGMGAETREECEEMLERITKGSVGDLNDGTEISYRHRCDLDEQECINLCG